MSTFEDEFNEEDLFVHEESEAALGHRSGEEDGTIFCMREGTPDSLTRGSVDIAHRKHDEVEQLADIDEDAEAPMAGLPKLGSGNRAAFGSVPADKAVRMGSSVPISIPGMLSGPSKKAPTRPTEELQYPGTFIPPHQLSQQTGFMLSMNGTARSPNGLMKRERLRVRNAILLSTGFLEQHADGTPVSPMQARAPRASSGFTGGLSKALHAGSPATPA